MHGVGRDCLLMGCGSTELLKVCADACLRPGTELLQAYPTYPTIERYGRVNGADIVSIPVDDRGEVDMAEMERRLGPRTAVAYLCNPNNPPGTIIPDTQVRTFLEKVPEGVLTVCDEAYHHYVSDSRYRSLIDAAASRRNLVVLRTFSKVYGLAGMRIGYAVAHPDTIEKLSPHRLSINLNNPGLHAAIAALGDRAFVDESVRMNARSRDAIAREMPRFGGRPVPSQAGFVWVAFDRETRPIRRALAGEHVYVRTYSHSPRHLRISTGTASDMERLFEAMEKVTAG
jgi:histidinol-phosphate aminotransferase